MTASNRRASRVLVPIIAGTFWLTGCPGSGAPAAPDTATGSARPTPRLSTPSPPPTSTDEVPDDTRPTLVVTRRDDTYVLDGSTPRAIARQLRRRGPEEFAGHVRYLITYRWAAIERPDQTCKLVAPRVALDYTVLLPKVAASVPSSVAAVVGPAIAQLRTHENGHVHIARETARRTLHVLSRMRSRPSRSCTRLDAEAGRAASRAVRIGDLRQRAYDASTNHGLDQPAGT